MRAGAPSMNAGARRRRLGVCALVIGLGVMAPAAHAERPVYRNLDDTGGVVYSDRALGPGSARVKSWKAASPSRSQYNAAVLRAESDRLYYERLRAEDRIPRPIAVYPPRHDVPQVTFPADYPPHRLRPRWDPNLPDSPAPSLERRYYYDGR
jgi:hypothetical protein